MKNEYKNCTPKKIKYNRAKWELIHKLITSVQIAAGTEISKAENPWRA